MKRTQKIALLKEIASGRATIHNTLEPRFALAKVDPDTGALIPWRATSIDRDPVREARNAELLKRAATDLSITVIKIIYE